MSDDQQYPWTRRPDETPVAYEAFRIYMNGGHTRSLANVAEAMGGNRRSAINKWSSAYEWVARTTAYDSYLTTAAVDGMADQVSQVRNKHLDVASKLLDHLMESMAGWAPGEDPSIRWTTAFSAAAKVQQVALSLKDTTTKTDAEIIDKILDAVARRAEG